MNQDEQNNDAESLHVETTSEQSAISTEVEKMREHQLEMIGIAQANTNSVFDFARDLLSAETPAQMMDLCTSQAQKRVAESSEQVETTASGQIPKAHIEARPKGHEFDPITDFAVEDDAGQLLGAFATQMEAIVWAKDEGHEALVTRDRHLSDKNNPDHWRSF